MELVTSSYKLELDNFQGPLDLLLHLIEKNQMDIYDIKIVEITNQYMDYIYSMEHWDIEFASEFLVMASTLLHIKSRTLLPKKKEEVVGEPDPRDDLVYRLIEYRKYKKLAKTMLEREQVWLRSLVKHREFIKFTREYEVIELSSVILKEKMLDINRRIIDSMNDNETKMKIILRQEKVSLREKMSDVVKKLRNSSSVIFSKIFHKSKDSKIVVITGFQAILELSKGKRIHINQKKPFGDIKITKASGYNDLLDGNNENNDRRVESDE